LIPVQRPYLGEEELAAIREVFDSRWLGMGAVTKEFESAIAALLGAKHVIAVNSGTSALHLALEAIGLSDGDEVIVPSLTFAASIQAIIAAGARPVFCEVVPATLNIDVADALNRVGPHSKAIMPVHYGGSPCDMDELLAGADRHSLRVVEDAAHAFGSRYRGRWIGSFGDVTCFSFDPIKNITCGEGGAVVTNSDSLAELMVKKRILGISNETLDRYRNERNWLYEVVTPGYRYHMSNINAAIGLQQLKRFDEFHARKCSLVTRYDSAFAHLTGAALVRHDLPETFPFFYILRILHGQREGLIRHLRSKGIATGVHYIPNHLQPLFAEYHTPLPATEQLYEEIVTLPLFYEMTDDEACRVIEAVVEFLGQ
jgi:dTDP-4-amino-4,6-dideoxygalactose transaminase